MILAIGFQFNCILRQLKLMETLMFVLGQHSRGYWHMGGCLVEGMIQPLQNINDVIHCSGCPYERKLESKKILIQACVYGTFILVWVYLWMHSSCLCMILTVFQVSTVNNDYAHCRVFLYHQHWKRTTDCCGNSFCQQFLRYWPILGTVSCTKSTDGKCAPSSAGFSSSSQLVQKTTDCYPYCEFIPK